MRLSSPNRIFYTYLKPTADFLDLSHVFYLVQMGKEGRGSPTRSLSPTRDPEAIAAHRRGSAAMTNRLQQIEVTTHMRFLAKC